jgi:Flp pilus assembly protein TadG
MKSPRRGAAATELAVLLPFLAVAFAAVVDLARALAAAQLVQAAALAGATTAAGTDWTPGYPGTATTAAKAAAVAAAPGLDPDVTADNVSVRLTADRATVTVAYDFRLFTAAVVPGRTLRLARTAAVPIAPRAGD